MSLAGALLEAAPGRVPKLVRRGHDHGDAQVIQILSGHSAQELFPGARAPQGALAGLYFYFGCWEQAHEAAQEDESAEGSYWHAIIHRQEPDASNAGYWFRRTGNHPVQQALAAQYGRWDPIEFVKECGQAQPGSEAEKRALERQLAEWRLLFDYCKEPA